jgi:hypothetical protein
MDVINKNLQLTFRRLLATAGVLGLQVSLLIFGSCIDAPELSDICPSPEPANAVGLKNVFFSPYLNQRYSSSSDTVPLSEFGFNFELEIQRLEAMNSSSLPGQAFALSCAQTFTIRNISDISVVLLQPFAGLPVGTDISYLLITPEGKKLSELRQFENVTIWFNTNLAIKPPNFSQLKTRTFLFLKNGTQKAVDSTSPVLKTL